MYDMAQLGTNQLLHGEFHRVRRPGVLKIAVPFVTPATARDSIAAAPIS
jgi:hypothetical protein